MKKFIIILIFLNIIIVSNISYGISEDILNSQKDMLNISDFLKEADMYSKEVFKDIDMSELLTSVMTGNIENEKIFGNVFNILGSEVKNAIKILGSILIIIVIHSILKSISESLGNESISKITYYVQYILIVTLIMSNFTDIIKMTNETIQNLVGFMNTLVPILITLMIATGNIISANIFQPILLFLISFIGNIISTIILPLVLITTVLAIVSKISDRVQVDKLSNFFKSSILWGLGIILTIFVGIVALEGSLSSSVDGLTAKTTKAAVSNFIPVVGKILRRRSGYSYRLC